VDDGSNALTQRSAEIELWGAIGIGTVPALTALVLLGSLSCVHPYVFYAPVLLGVVLFVSLSVGLDSFAPAALALADTCAAPNGTLRAVGRTALGVPDGAVPADSESLALLLWYTGDCDNSGAYVPSPLASAAEALTGAANASSSATELYEALLSGGTDVPAAVLANASLVANSTASLVGNLTALQSDFLSCGAVQLKLHRTVVQLCGDVGHRFGLVALGLGLLWMTLVAFLWVAGCMCQVHPYTESKLEYSRLGMLRRLADREHSRLHPGCCSCQGNNNGGDRSDGLAWGGRHTGTGTGTGTGAPLRNTQA